MKLIRLDMLLSRKPKLSKKLWIWTWLAIDEL